MLILILLRRFIAFPKKYLWLFLIVPIVTMGFGFLRGFFTGDAFGYWLPVAKKLVEDKFIPEFFTGTHFSRMPLLSLLFAFTFSIFNSFNEFLCLWIPFFFSAATLVVLHQWGKYKRIHRKFLFFIPILFLTNILVEFWGGWNLLQEPLILFFATTFFYYYEKYLDNNRVRDLIFLSMSFVLACASKISGWYLSFLILYIFLRGEHKYKTLLYLAFFSIPLLLWLLRNYLVFDNPFFPLLNGFFKGKYYLIVKKWHTYHSYALFNKFSDRFLFVFYHFWIAIPFVLLSFYEFFKQRHYEYLFLFFSYSLFKEMFLFTPTSCIRYYYLFLGLFLIYGFLGLQRIKSKLAIFSLLILGILGLLSVPVTHSSSKFISSFEQKFSSLSYLFDFLHNHWYFVLFILSPFIYFVSCKKYNKIFLIFIYALSILHLRFVANKSWLNTWTFIFLAIIILIFLAFRHKIRYKHLKLIIVSFIILVILFNSWIMGFIYYWRHKTVFPPSFLWKTSRWANEILNKCTNSAERKNFYIIITAQKDFYNWRSEYRSIEFLDFNFWNFIREYNSDLSGKDIHKLLIKKKIKYIIKNATYYEHNSLANNELNQFFEKIRKTKDFKLIGNLNNQYFIWQVY
ncbi:hypothetical protein DRN69_00765 [Candidatus Pacearchaeota archaeon]|nr:MAG: hypothetical protein DRN69_00765 [Candidatus Pacearchaeota archaeon]